MENVPKAAVSCLSSHSNTTWFKCGAGSEEFVWGDNHGAIAHTRTECSCCCLPYSSVRTLSMTVDDCVPLENLNFLVCNFISPKCEEELYVS